VHPPICLPPSGPFVMPSTSPPTPGPHSLLSLQNFYPGLTSVVIGSLVCEDAVITDDVSLGALQCVAPPGPGFGDVHLTVLVAGGGNASVPFLYSAPEVTRTSVAACAADANVVIYIHGSNLGLRNTIASPDPVVYIGDSTCFQPVLFNSSVLQCTALASPVGAYPVKGACHSAVPMRAFHSCALLNHPPMVITLPLCTHWTLDVVGAPLLLPTVSLNGQNSSGSVVLHRLCGAGTFALPGDECQACPKVLDKFAPVTYSSPVSATVLKVLWTIVRGVSAECRVCRTVPRALGPGRLLSSLPHGLCELCARSGVPWGKRRCSHGVLLRSTCPGSTRVSVAG
jgi:hypothetical protein